MPNLGFRFVITVVLLFFGISFHHEGWAEHNVPLINGLTLRGSVVELPTLNENAFQPSGAPSGARTIWMIDDQLRRVFIHRHAMVAVPEDGVIPQVPGLRQRITIDQPVASGGKALGSIGAILQVSPFNEFGRRQVMIPGPDGKTIVVWQGITEVTARYIKLQALIAARSYVWESRIATSSIPRHQLREILHRRLRPLDFEKRLDLVRLFIEAEMFEMARLELEELVRENPDQANLKKQLTSLVQEQAIQLLQEAKRRQQAGQYRLAKSMMTEFPLEDFAGVTKLQFRDAADALESQLNLGPKLLGQLSQQVTELGPDQLDQWQPVLDEMREQFSPNTMARLNDYQRLGNDQTLDLESRVALAFGGWMLGPGSGLQNLVLGQSLVRMRQLVWEYLATDNQAQRQVILTELRQTEGVDVPTIAKILPLLPPPLPLPERPQDLPFDRDNPPGLYQLSISGTEELATDYLIQLPPEYDPLRQYPTIVSLHAPAGSPRGQVDWWAGAYDDKLQLSLGQASRLGYVVVAPRWTRDNQSRYEFTEREHHRVLASVRDAMRRVSIDADRIFLTGHGEGGTAAWDIALSHPDLWAGLISIGGEPDKFILSYRENARALPIYIVLGEMAGSQSPLVRFGYALDRYMHPKQNAMVVLYRGRGPEHFQEEIHHLFDWMSLRSNERRPLPQAIEMSTMRANDRFFWWLEMSQVNERNVVNPFLWDQFQRKPLASVKAGILPSNTVHISKGPTQQFQLWLRPDMGIELNEQINIRYNARTTRYDFDGDIATILEDARVRADRKRPFWATVPVP